MMNSPFREAVIGFVWSVWGEIGVPSVERRPLGMAIDLEALIHLTDIVGKDDFRLQSHTAAWLETFPELVSKARLKRLGSTEPDSPTPRPRDSMSGGSSLDVTGSSAIQLRIRSALGVSARAEIVRQCLVDTPGTRRSSSELAQLAGYTRRNVEKALESLERGQWVTRIRGGASLRWELVDHAALVRLFSPVPTSNTSFLALCRIVEELITLDDVGSDRAQVRSATARQVLVELQPTADWGNVRLPEVPSAADARDTALAWVTGLPSTALHESPVGLTR